MYYTVRDSLRGVKKQLLTPREPSDLYSRALLTKPYAPRPISRSIKKSEMVFPSGSFCPSDDGVGDLVLTDDSIFPALPDRRRICGITGDGDGGSIGAIETRPAMRETRCWDDRLRGRGRVGERGDNERFASG